MIRELARRRAANTDYFDSLPNAQPDIRNAVLRDVENKVESSRNDKERAKTANEKEAKTRTGKGADKGGRATAKADPRGKQWSEGDSAACGGKQNAGAPTKEPGEADKPGENKTNVSKKEVICTPPPVNGPPYC